MEIISIYDDGYTSFIPYGSVFPVSGTIKDAEGNPLIRQVSAYFEINGKLVDVENRGGSTSSPPAVFSNADGSFLIGVNENTMPVTVVAHGDVDENNQIFKGIQVP